MIAWPRMESLYTDPLEAAESVEKRSPSKLRRSCESCRASKEKCILSKGDIKKCQKCLKERKRCVFLEAKPRPKKAGNSRTRVAEMEQRIDGLYALLSAASNDAKEKGAMNPPANSLPPSLGRIERSSPQPALSEFFTPHTAPRVSPESPKPPWHQSMWSMPHLIFDAIEDVLSKGVVSLPEAEESLRLFRTKAVNFPFVLVPPHMSLDFMRREKPFLFLTILTWGAQETFKIQKALEIELREQLSRKVVINGEKSLDLLQGILVYLCWYQFYFTPERQQIYQLLQMAVTMAVDLGINQTTQIPSQQNDFSFLNVTPQALNAVRLPERLDARPTVPEEIESRRAFLGCYWLSSTALVLRKPTTLKYSSYIEECVHVLAHVADAETDYLLPQFIALQKFSEDINHAFGYDATLQHSQMDPARIEILSSTFTQQLDQLYYTMPPDIWENVQLSMFYNFLRIYINEVGFHASPLSSLELVHVQPSHRAWYSSSARRESLIACLQASKNYLDRFIDLAPRQTIDFTVPNYLHLVYAVLILGRFTIGYDCPVLDASYVRKSANMGYYLNKLIGKANDVIMLSPNIDVNDTFCHLRTLWEQSKQWFEEVTTDPACARESFLVQPELNLLNILPGANGKCVDFLTTVGRCDERWTDMLDFGLSN